MKYENPSIGKVIHTHVETTPMSVSYELKEHLHRIEHQEFSPSVKRCRPKRYSRGNASLLHMCTEMTLVLLR
jgi:hypothetical protein